jgi:hypothetical protein
MSIIGIVTLILALLGVVSGIIAIGLLFYIGKTRIKEIDKAVLGYEFPHDSIFALIIRVPNYAGGFMWKWSARRGHLEGKIEHFDQKFQWPFKAVMVLMILVLVCFGVGIALDKIYGLS